MKVLEKIKEWQDAGILTAEQAKAIKNYEENHPEQNWLIYGFLGLGALIVAIGVISLIAANWAVIPAWVKLTTHFGFYGIFIWLATKFFQAKKHLYFEILLVFLPLYCLASIGLVSQIYHSGGALYQAGLFWSLLNFGMLFLTRRGALPSLWAGVFFISLTLYAWNDTFLKEFYGRNLLPLYLGLPFFCLLFTLLFKKWGGEYVVTKVFRRICFIVGVVGLFFAESQITYVYQKPYLLLSFLPSYLLIFFGLFVLWKSVEYRLSQKKLLSLLISFYTILLHLPVLRVDNKFLLASISILILTFAAIYMGSLNYKKLFETFLVLIFLRFFGLYLQALGGLATTGIGLIVSGLVMIGLVLVWHKKRQQISNWANEVME